MAETIEIYSGETSLIVESNRFQKATCIYIENLSNELELEVDAYLNIYISNSETRKISLENFNKTNILDTIDIYLIPQEYANSGMDMSVILVSDISVNVAVYARIPDSPNIDEFILINEKLDLILENQSTPVITSPIIDSLILDNVDAINADLAFLSSSSNNLNSAMIGIGLVF